VLLGDVLILSSRREDEFLEKCSFNLLTGELLNIGFRFLYWEEVEMNEL